MNNTATKQNDIFNGVISTGLISLMAIGEVIKVPAEKADILRSRVGEVNSAFRIAGQPYRWITFTRTASLGYVSVTRLN